MVISATIALGESGSVPWKGFNKVGHVVTRDCDQAPCPTPPLLYLTYLYGKFETETNH